MATHPDSKPATREAQVLDRLIAARGIGSYGLFFVSGEGQFFPNGVEEASGFAISDLGQVYAFWTGWDSKRREVIFSQWETAETEPDWVDDDEYQRARHQAGLD
jgi:hypothetical protein